MANQNAPCVSLKPELFLITTQEIFTPDGSDNGRREPETPDLSPSQPGPRVAFAEAPDPGSRPGPRIPDQDARGEQPRAVRWSVVHRYRKWQSPILMLVFWLIGVTFSFAHCIFYASLGGTIVGAPWQQETNLRVGTAFAFVSQIFLSASVWQTYTQWIWRSIAKITLRMATLNDIFGADTSILWLRNFKMFKKFTVGYLIALYAWTLILPPFFTPGTLFVYDDVNQVMLNQSVPYPTISNHSQAHNYSYSPDYYRDFADAKSNVTKFFRGPRTILTLLATLIAGGQMLFLKPQYNHSSYDLTFFAPTIRCSEADDETKQYISTFQQQKMATPVGAARELRSAYFAFVPGFDSQGKPIKALTDARYQAQINGIGSNQIWMVTERYNYSTPDCGTYQYYQVCKLWNATYDVHYHWEHGYQAIEGTATLLNEVDYPADRIGVESNMAQHAYSAYMWALSDQIVGYFGWFGEDENSNSTTNATSTTEFTPTRQYGLINSAVQHNVLLGSSDLDTFFDYNDRKGSCLVDFSARNLQRQQDILLARNRTMAELIEELSFNTTVGLQHNDLLTRNVSREVTRWDDVNRYGYSKAGLFVPYALVCLFTTATVAIGFMVVLNDGVMPNKEFQDIVGVADVEAVNAARAPDGAQRKLSVAYNQGGVAQMV